MIKYIAILILSLLIIDYSSSVPIQWNSGIGQWSTSGKWNTSTIPTLLDDVYIGISNASNCAITSPAQCKSLELSNQARLLISNNLTIVTTFTIKPTANLYIQHNQYPYIEIVMTGEISSNGLIDISSPVYIQSPKVNLLSGSIIQINNSFVTTFSINLQNSNTIDNRQINSSMVVLHFNMTSSRYTLQTYSMLNTTIFQLQDSRFQMFLGLLGVKHFQLNDGALLEMSTSIIQITNTFYQSGNLSLSKSIMIVDNLDQGEGIRMAGTAVTYLEKNSYVNSTKSYSAMLDKSKLVVTSSSAIEFVNMYMGLFNESQVSIDNSSLIIRTGFDDTKLYFVMFNQTSMYITNTSFFALIGVASLFNRSTVYIGGDSKFYNDGLVQLNDLAQLQVLGSLMGITKMFILNDNSTAMFASGSSLIVTNGSIKVNDNSILAVDSSEIIVNGGDLIVSSQFVCTSSNITIRTGNYQSITANAETVFRDSEILVFGNFNPNNGKISLERSIIYSNGLIRIGRLGVLYAENSVILIPNGTISYQLGSQIYLRNTTIFNQNGVLDSDGDLYIDSNSIVQNNSTFTKTSGTIVLNGGTIQSTTILEFNGGSLVGEGHIDSNLTLDQGSILGEHKTLLNVTINGTISFNSINTTTIINILSLDQYSTLNISGNVQLNGTIKIRISKHLTLDANQESTIDLINYSSNQENTTFSNVKIVTYDPDTQEESESNCNSKHSTNEKSFSVLLSDCNDGQNNDESSSLSTGAKIGIAVGIVGAAAIIGLIIWKKRSISNSIKYRKERFKNIKMRQG